MWLKLGDHALFFVFLNLAYPEYISIAAACSGKMQFRNLSVEAPFYFNDLQEGSIELL